MTSVDSPPSQASSQNGPRRGHFIPLRKQDLIALLTRLMPLEPAEIPDFDRFCRLLDASVHHAFHERLQRLQHAYAAFDPDTDLMGVERQSAEERDQQAKYILAELAYLLERANFRRLTDSDIDQAIRAMSHWGVRLSMDLRIFKQLDVYARGDRLDTRKRRRLVNLWRVEWIAVPLYQRLAVAYRLNPDHPLGEVFHHDHIYLRIFKNIPELDVDMVLPGGKIKMSLFDHGKILFPTVSGIATVIWKILKGAVIVAAVGVYGLLAYMGLLIGTLGAGWRSFFGYLRTKEKYQLNLTQSLYYQNLDNNLGMLRRVAGEAEDQDFREALVAYYLLWRAAPAEGWTTHELDERADRLLIEQVCPLVDFETSDALVKLVRWHLVEQDAQGRYRARPLSAALAKLDESWDNWIRTSPPDSTDSRFFSDTP